MQTLIGKFLGGNLIEIESPPKDWVKGETVSVERTNPDEEFDLGEQGDDQESIERWIVEVNAIPKSAWTDADEAKWQAARAERKAFELSKWEENAAKLKAMVE